MGSHQLSRPRRLIVGLLAAATLWPVVARGGRSFIPIPEIITDPNEGNTVGLLAVLLFTDEKEQIQYMVAPDLRYNKTTGVFPAFRFFGYPSSERRYSVVVAKSTTKDEDYELEYTDRSFWDGRGFLLASFLHEADSTERFFGFGNESREERPHRERQLVRQVRRRLARFHPAPQGQPDSRAARARQLHERRPGHALLGALLARRGAVAARLRHAPLHRLQPRAGERGAAHARLPEASLRRDPGDRGGALPRHRPRVSPAERLARRRPALGGRPRLPRRRAPADRGLRRHRPRLGGERHLHRDRLPVLTSRGGGTPVSGARTSRPPGAATSARRPCPACRDALTASTVRVCPLPSRSRCHSSSQRRSAAPTAAPRCGHSRSVGGA